MDSSVEQLMRIMPPPVEGGSAVDWERLEHDYGISFPSDFRDFAQVYGAGIVDDYISVSVPDPGNRFVDLLQKSRDFTATLKGVQETLPAQMSHLLDSRIDEILMWAADEDGDLCFWTPEGRDPEHWNVGVYSRNFNDWTQYSCGFAEFLVEVLTRVTESPFYRSDFPSEYPAFKTWRKHLDDLLAEE